MVILRYVFTSCNVGPRCFYILFLVGGMSEIFSENVGTVYSPSVQDTELLRLLL
jgi:hypothetical protein